MDTNKPIDTIPETKDKVEVTVIRPIPYVGVPRSLPDNNIDIPIE
jgi:hypothetical protein